MRRITLFMLIVFTITAHGQNKLLSSVVEGYQSGNWQKSSGTNYEYDSNNNLILETELQWNSVNNSWKIQYKTIYTYNANNKVTEQLNLYLNQTTNVFENSYKITSTYNINGLLTEELIYDWTDSNWVVSDKFVTSYNGSNLLIGYTGYTKSDAQWLESFKGTFAYNLNNNVTEQVNQDFVNQVWVNSYKTAFTCNNKSQLVTKTYDEWDMLNATWNHTYTYTYGFDDVGNTTSRKLTNPQDLTYNYLDEYTYALTTTMANFANPFKDKNGVNYLFEDVKRVGKALGYTTSSNNGSDYNPTSRTTYNYNNYNTLDTALSISKTIAGGLFHSLYICNDGTVMTWGWNVNGELGNGTKNNSDIPLLVSSFNGATALSGGRYYSLALKNDGTVWAWGNNSLGQLGNGTYTPSSVPVQVNYLTEMTAIEGGEVHSLGLRKDGTVWAWGSNNKGQLGNGTIINSNVPVIVLPEIIAIAGGSYHSLALKNNGTIWAWGGLDYSGMLGNGTNNGSKTPVQVSFLTDVIAIEGGGNNSNGYSFALKNDGTVWAWGDNYNGRLGNGTNISSNVPVQLTSLSGIIAIEGGVGNDHSLVLKNDGTVWAWGDNYFGQLGNGTNTNSNFPVQVNSLTGITSIAAAGQHCLAKKNDGTVWAWGDNSSGQLGNGNRINSNIPVQVTGLCNNLGIEENLIQNSVLIYPNPSKGIINLDLTYVNETELNVYNIIGQKVLTKKINEKKSKLDLNKFDKGVYFLNFKNNGGASVQKIILDK